LRMCRKVWQKRKPKAETRENSKEIGTRLSGAEEKIEVRKRCLSAREKGGLEKWEEV